ncbi:MAG: hypothetical protein WAM73_05360 [Desulfobacterales bacterium]
MEKWKAENQAWRQLYELAEEVRNLAPWQWMREQKVFGVEDAAGGNVHFVSVMGSEGMHFGVSAYPGIQALSRIKNLNEQGIYDYPERLLEIPQIQLSFEDRKHLADHAYRKIRALGLRYRGQNAWPQFRSFRPGYAPWRLQADEMHVMSTVLEQLLEVAPLLRSNPDLLAFDDFETFLVRVPAGSSRKTWRNEPRRFRTAPEEKPAASLSKLSAARLRKLKRQPVFLEVDFFMTPAMIGKKGDRMLNGYALLAVENSKGMIIGLEMLVAEPSLQSMWRQIPEALAKQLTKAGFLPKALVVRSTLLAHLLDPFAKALDCELLHSDTLPNLDPAKESLSEHLGQGRG